MKTLTAEIISIGDELLIGQVVNTNASFLAKSLTELGITVMYISTCCDTVEDITSALQLAHSRVTVVLVTGGLGPTRDDVTKAALCQFYATELVFNEEVYSHLEYLFANYIKAPMNAHNRDQAKLPKSCTVLFNDHGTAPGMLFEHKGVMSAFMPGVPFEMKSLFENKLKQKLLELPGRTAILQKTLITYGVGESRLAERIEDLEDSLPQGFSLAYLPNFGRVRLRITAKVSAHERFEAEQKVNAFAQQLKDRLFDCYQGEETEGGLESRILRLAKQKGVDVVTAESFTSGRIASTLSSVSGSSAYFLGGYITYATDMKSSMLGVSKDLIEAHSVVSAEVACAMAEGARLKSGADLAIASTGNAGPTKGDSDAEVGQIYLAISTSDKTEAYLFSMGTHRERVIGRSVSKALELIYNELLNL
ncbi:MAG: Putative competence-damage inducible protein [Flavobacteriaceae bacterium]|nr:MAG: Putative competence-damage inducible protein [Flavobacteriaceae bacterium]